MITYNHEHYIEQAVRSVLAQETEFSFEIVIGEDCSTDKTREVLIALEAAHPGRLRLLLYPKNLGLMGKRNMAAVLAECAGEYVVFLEGDDYWSSTEKIQKQVQFLDSHPECAGCFHEVWLQAKDGPASRCGYGFPPEISQGGPGELLRYGFPHMMTLMFRRRLLPGFPDWFYELGMGDWSLNLLLSERGPLAYLRGEALSTYRVHDRSCWLTQPLLKRTQQEIAAFAAFDRHLGGRHKQEVGHQINAREFWLVDAYAESGDYEQSRRAFGQAVNHWWRYRGVEAAWVVRYFFRSYLPGFTRRYRKLRATR